MAGSAARLGSSTADGWVSLGTDEIPPKSGLLFSHPDYLSTFIEDFQGLRVHPFVVLEAGNAVMFRCTTSDGRPVEGAVVTLSMTALPGAYRSEPASNSTPGWPRQLAVLGGTTDQSGVARVGGLEPGRYHFECRRKGFVQVDSSHASVAVVPDPGEIRIVLAPLFLFLASLSDDEVLAHKFEFSEEDGWRVPSSLSGPLIAAREEAESLHSNALVSCAASMGNLPGATASLSLVSKKGGSQEFDVPGYPLGLADTVLELNGAAPDGVIRLETWVSVTDATGRALDPRDFYATVGLPGSEFWFLPDTTGRLWLAEGEHELKTKRQTLRARYQPTRIRAGEHNVVQTLDPLRRCLLDYRYAWGEVASNVKWNLTWANGSYTAFTFTEQPLDVLLPPGELSVNAKVFGRAAVLREVVIPSDLAEEVLAITVSEEEPGR